MAGGNNLSSVFVSHVKTLFDILDENRTGLVRLSDIEGHWDGNDCVISREIVIQSLRNVASPGGRLSFDTLIAGLDRALMLWKTNGSGRRSEITSSTENRESSSGNIPNGRTPHELVSSKSDSNSFDSERQQKCGQRSLASWNGLLKSADAEYNNGPASSDALKLRKHERITGGHNGEYTHAQKRKGSLSFNFRWFSSHW